LIPGVATRIVVCSKPAGSVAMLAWIPETIPPPVTWAVWVFWK
jgi:hypothetical protein